MPTYLIICQGRSLSEHETVAPRGNQRELAASRPPEATPIHFLPAHEPSTNTLIPHCQITQIEGFQIAGIVGVRGNLTTIALNGTQIVL